MEDEQDTKKSIEDSQLNRPREFDMNLLLQELRAEREKYLERVYPVGRSPAFVIELKSGDGEDFSLEDVKTAVEIRNTLIGDGKNAVDNIHREAESLHVSGVLLTPEGLENLKTVLEQLSTAPEEGQASLYNPSLSFQINMATPHKKGIQYVTVDQNGRDFTILGPAVLAGMRGDKETTSSLDEIPVYRLAHRDDDPKQVIMGKKDTPIVRESFSNCDIQWATEDQIEALPDAVFKKIDPDSIYMVELDMNEYMAVKADVNGAGKKIEQNLDPDDPLGSGEDVQLVIGANYHLQGATEEFMKLRAEDKNEFMIVVNRLGESRLWFIPRYLKGDEAENSVVRGTYEAVMRDMAEKGLPDVFLKIEDVKKYLQAGSLESEKSSQDDDQSGDKPESKTEKSQRAYEQRIAVLGYQTSIEMPMTGFVRFFMSEGRAIAFDKKWDVEEEIAREKAHKRRGMRPSEIYSPIS